MRNDYSTFERIWNVQILALQTVFICLLSLPFLCVSYLCDVMLFTMTWSVTCPLTLCNITEHRHVKCPVHFFRWNNFSSPVWSTRKAIVVIPVVSICVRIHFCVIVLCSNLSNLTYFDNHLSETFIFGPYFFTVQWFCLISWRLFDLWTSYFGIISQYELMFASK